MNPSIICPRHRPPGRCGALKFLFGDSLIRNDVLDRHFVMPLYNPTPTHLPSTTRYARVRCPLKGEKPRQSKHRTLALPMSAPTNKIETTPMPFPLRSVPEGEQGRGNSTQRTMMPIGVRFHPPPPAEPSTRSRALATLSEPRRNYLECKKRPIHGSLFVP
jgi:acyl-CoA thioesterase